MFHLSLSALLSKTNIAVLISIAIHGVIAVAFPDVAIIPKPEKTTNKKTIRLISIDPNRLPNLSQSLPTVPGFPQTQSKILPPPSPTPTPPVTKIVTPPTPPPLNLEILSLETPKPTPTPTPTPTAIVPSPKSFPSPSPEIQIRTPSNPPKSRLRQERDLRAEELAIQRELEKDIVIDPRITAERQPPDQPLKYPYPAITGESAITREEIDQLLPPDQSEEEIVFVPIPTPSPTPSPTPTPTPTDSTDISNNGENEPIAPEIEDWWKDIIAMADNLGENLIDTTDEEAQENEANWLAKIDPVEAEILTIEGKYPEDACFLELEGTTIYGVLVNQRGKVRDLDLIRSSGYRIFNQQAINDILTSSFAPGIDQSQAYQVSVNFVYDTEACPIKTLPEPEAAIPLTEKIENSTSEEVLIEPGEIIPEPESIAKPEDSSEKEVFNLPPETVPEGENNEAPTEEEALMEPRLFLPEPES